ncbi:MAG: O-antigen ligase family protein [Desulfomicrobium sp.]
MKNARLLPILLAGYLFLLIFRPYEYWTILGEFRVERIYMLFLLAAVLLSKEKRFLSDSLNGVIILFSLTLFISGLFSISWDSSWHVIDDYLKYVIFYFVITLCVRDGIDFRFIILSFIVVMFLYVGKSAWEFFVNGRFVYRMGISRMIGIDITYGDPNSFSATICYSLPLSWAMIRSRFENAWLRRCLWMYWCLALLAVIMTGSRSGMLTALLFFSIIFMTTSRKAVAVVVIIAALIFLWQAMPEDLQTRFLTIFVDDIGPESAQQSAAGRLKGFKHGMSLFINNPLLGVGPNNFPLSWSSRMNAHNLYGQLFGELGFFGGVTFGAFLILVILKNSDIIRKYNIITVSKNFKDPSLLPHSSSSLIVNQKQNRHSLNQKSLSNNYILFKDLGPVKLIFYSFVSQAIIQTIILMLFKGWSDHNLYRYTWLWIAGLTVLAHHFFCNEVKRIEQS